LAELFAEQADDGARVRELERFRFRGNARLSEGNELAADRIAHNAVFDASPDAVVVENARGFRTVSELFAGSGESNRDGSGLPQAWVTLDRMRGGRERLE